MIKKKCPICDKIFYKYEKRIIFCSRKCYLISHKEKTVKITCPVCAKVFERPVRVNQIFCSRACSMVGKTVRECRICGNNFYGNASQRYCDKCRHRECSMCGKRFLIKPKANEVQKYCSKKCSSKAQIGRKLSPETIAKVVAKTRGRKTGKFFKCDWCKKKIYKMPSHLMYKKHFCSNRCKFKHWEKNASPKRNNKGKEKEWKIEVYQGDDYVCWVCNGYGLKLNAHHLYSWKDYPNLRFELSNGITLCMFCHKTYTDYGKH